MKDYACMMAIEDSCNLKIVSKTCLTIQKQEILDSCTIRLQKDYLVTMYTDMSVWGILTAVSLQ